MIIMMQYDIGALENGRIVCRVSSLNKNAITSGFDIVPTKISRSAIILPLCIALLMQRVSQNAYC